MVVVVLEARALDGEGASLPAEFRERLKEGHLMASCAQSIAGHQPGNPPANNPNMHLMRLPLGLESR